MAGGEGYISPAMTTAGAWTADEEVAYADFYVAWFRRVVRTAYLVTRDRVAAEDVAQDAFVELYLRWPKIREYDKPEAWVRRVALRLAARAARRERLRSALSLRAHQEAIPAPGDGDGLVEEALGAIPPKQRVVIALHYYEDLSVLDIARGLRMSESAVKVNLHRGRQALALRLSREEVARD
jgi:RNA polymerase sigma-70 factor (ECF subfamily)